MDGEYSLTTRQRLLVAAVAGALMAALTYHAYGLAESPSSDFDQIWTAVHPFVHGQDPYKAVAASKLHAPLFYPLTALITVAPLGFLSAGVARIVFAALGYGALAYAGAGRRGGLFLGVLSASAINAAGGGKWSPLFTAGAAVPWLSVFWVAKPNLGLSLAAGYPHRQALWGAVAVTLLSFVLMPGWLAEWLGTVGDRVHQPLVFRPGGFLLLLAAIRWRRPEARLLLALGCIPGSSALYETVPLFLIPANRYEGYVLTILSFVAAALMGFLVPAGTAPEMMTGWWPYLLWLLYVPALAMVLRRPNEWPDDGKTPKWLRELASRIGQRTRQPNPR
jgi:hypothetical protein